MTVIVILKNDATFPAFGVYSHASRDLGSTIEFIWRDVTKARALELCEKALEEPDITIRITNA